MKIVVLVYTLVCVDLAYGVITADGIKHGDEATLQQVLQGNGLDVLDYFANAIRVSDSSGGYLGTDADGFGWVITCNHVTPLGVGASINVQGVLTSVVSSQRISGTDIQIYKVSGVQDVTLSVMPIANLLAGLDTDVVMIGGGNAGAGNLNWGTNVSSPDLVYADGANPTMLDFYTQSQTVGVNPYSAQAVVYDSGGCVFAWDVDLKTWALAGIMQGTSDNYTLSISLAEYRGQITAITGLDLTYMPGPRFYDISGTVTAGNYVYKDVRDDGILIVGEGISAGLDRQIEVGGRIDVAGGTISLGLNDATNATIVQGAVSTTGTDGHDGVIDITSPEGVVISDGGFISGGTITVTDGTMKGKLTDKYATSKSESTLEDFSGTAAIAVAGGTGTLSNVTVGTGGLTVAAGATVHLTTELTIAAGGIAHISGTVAGEADTGIMVGSGGELSGSGSFGNKVTVAGGGTIIVGNSPGHQTYNQLELGGTGTGAAEVVFSIDGVNAATGASGWGSGDFSRISINGTGADSLVISAGTIFTFELSLDYCNTLTRGDTLSFDIITFASAIADINAWNTLLEGITINFAEGLASDGITHLTAWGIDNARLVLVNVAGDNYAIQFTANYIPEPTTATLGILGLAGLLLRRRRK